MWSRWVRKSTCASSAGLGMDAGEGLAWSHDSETGEEMLGSVVQKLNGRRGL